MNATPILKTRARHKPLCVHPVDTLGTNPTYPPRPPRTHKMGVRHA
jgi:hypothetical protein